MSNTSLRNASPDSLLLAIGEAAHYTPVGTGWTDTDLPVLEAALHQEQDHEAAPSLDFAVANHGTIHLLTPLTDEASDWVEYHLPEDAPRFGNAIAVEHRYIDPILCGIEHAGLEVAYQ